jgi:mannose-6-phosphate isomerase-like protein (cupin superfamily)
MTQALSLFPSPAVAGSDADGPHLILDRDGLPAKLSTRACWVHHRLVDHPLFALPRLLDLARRLPQKYVRINSGAVPVNAKPAEIPGTGLNTDESFRLIEETNTRIMLKHIELDPEYRDLLHSCIAEIEALGHPSMRNIHSRVGYVFISSPNQVTPYHMDPEINFLLQIHGQKTFFVLPGEDRAILSEEDIELFYSGKHVSLPFKEQWKGRAAPFEMSPGDGVHIPVNHPHWVTTNNEVTISFALTVESAWTNQRGVVYAVNHHLRRRGLKPVPFGRSRARDFLKYQGYRLWNSLSSLFARKQRPAP